MYRQDMIVVVSLLFSTNVPDWPQDERPKKSLVGALCNLEGTDKGCRVYKGNVDDHGPVEVALLIVITGHLGDVAEHLE